MVARLLVKRLVHLTFLVPRFESDLCRNEEHLWIVLGKAETFV